MLHLITNIKVSFSQFPATLFCVFTRKHSQSTAHCGTLLDYHQSQLHTKWYIKMHMFEFIQYFNVQKNSLKLTH